MIKKMISKKKVDCPKCGKKGILRVYDSGDSFCEHKRTKSGLKILGQSVMHVDGCYMKKEKAPNEDETSSGSLS